MTQYLPPNLLALFQARPPIPYLPPPDIDKKKLPTYDGVSAFLSQFEDPSTVDYSKIPSVETKDKKRKRIQMEKLEKNQGRIENEISKWDPREDPEATGDAYKTLFVARLVHELFS
jgi:U1 small nuclear ribonucleoprotein